MSAETDIGRQWVAKARSDLLNADNNLASGVVPCDTVCFHCQQAAEKMLKGALAAMNVPPPRTHDLLLLLELILPLFPGAEVLRDCLVILMPYSVAARYPDDDADPPSLADAREARRCADRVSKWLAAEMPEVEQQG